MSSPLTAGTLIQSCYRLHGILTRGEFGFIYMAIDQNQADQPCILEEFQPIDRNPALLLQLQDYFQKAIVELMPLHHPQILRLLSIITAADRLFLVQADIAANTCREVLNERLAQGQTFSEAEVRQFLTAILPALAYLHDRGICHSNLSLDSILLQEADQLPVLSNFGLVRRVAIEQQFLSRHPTQSMAWLAAQSHPTPAADFYDLATVILALLTGQELADGKDPQQWMNWRKLVSPAFARVLRRMLLPQTSTHFPSAQKLGLALRSLKDQITNRETAIYSVSLPIAPVSPSTPSISPLIDRRLTLISRSANTQQKQINSLPFPPTTSPQRDFSIPILATVFIVLAVLVTWRITNLGPKPVESNLTVAIASVSPTTEAKMSVNLHDRCRQLGIRYSLLVELVDELFDAKHPDWVNRSLSGAVEETMKAEWHQLATTVLARLARLSQPARQDMGTYNRATYDRWLATVHPPLNPQTIEAQADAEFLNLFPEQQGKTPNPRRLGQVWYAIARDTINGQSLKK